MRPGSHRNGTAPPATISGCRSCPVYPIYDDARGNPLLRISNDEAKTAEGARRLLASTLASYDSEQPIFALAVEEKVSHAFVGCCGVHPLDAREVEIFYAVVPECWRRGMATEMTHALTSYLFEQTGVNVIKAFIVPGHEASKRIARKVGFRHTGLVANPNFSEKVHQYVLARHGS